VFLVLVSPASTSEKPACIRKTSPPHSSSQTKVRAVCRLMIESVFSSTVAADTGATSIMSTVPSVSNSNTTLKYFLIKLFCTICIIYLMPPFNKVYGWLLYILLYLKLTNDIIETFNLRILFNLYSNF